MERGSRPHVMVLPYPAQGHLTPMMHFSLKLAAHGILVTFVTTQYMVAHTLSDEWAKLTATHGIRLAGLDDGLPEGNPRDPGTMDFIHAVQSLGGQLELLLRSSAPPPSCLVCDFFLTWTQPLAAKLGIPHALFWTQSLAVASAFMSMSKIMSTGYDPFAERVKARGERALVVCIPGLPDMDPFDLPYNFEMDFPPADNEITSWFRNMIELQFSSTAPNSIWFIVNSSTDLEGPIAHALSASSPVPASKLLLLGPLNDDTINSHSAPLICPSLWKQNQDDCLGWLDTQKDASVLYISFGSIAVRATEALQEVAAVLLARRQPFLWVMRTELEGARSFLSKAFWEFAMEAGKVATWVPQLKVLSHRAVGGFFSHAGWNSTVESISKGVPILAWPCFMDQFTNSWAISQYWKVGVQVT